MVLDIRMWFFPLHLLLKNTFLFWLSTGFRLVSCFPCKASWELYFDEEWIMLKNSPLGNLVPFAGLQSERLCCSWKAQPSICSVYLRQKEKKRKEKRKEKKEKKRKAVFPNRVDLSWKGKHFCNKQKSIHAQNMGFLEVQSGTSAHVLVLAKVNQVVVLLLLLHVDPELLSVWQTSRSVVRLACGRMKDQCWI